MNHSNSYLHMTLRVDRLQYFALNISERMSLRVIVVKHTQNERVTFMRGKGRRAPSPRPTELPPVLTLQKGKHRLLCTHWLSHRFLYPRQEEMRNGDSALDQAFKNMDRLIKKKTLSDRECDTLSEAVDTIRRICPQSKKRNTAS